MTAFLTPSHVEINIAPHLTCHTSSCNALLPQPPQTEADWYGSQTQWATCREAASCRSASHFRPLRRCPWRVTSGESAPVGAGQRVEGSIPSYFRLPFVEGKVEKGKGRGINRAKVEGSERERESAAVCLCPSQVCPVCSLGGSLDPCLRAYHLHLDLCLVYCNLFSRYRLQNVCLLPHHIGYLDLSCMHLCTPTVPALRRLQAGSTTAGMLSDFIPTNPPPPPPCVAAPYLLCAAGWRWTASRQERRS